MGRPGHRRGVYAHYNLDRAVLSLSKKEKPTEEAQTTEQQAPVETTSEVHQAGETTEERSPEEKHPAKKAKGGRKASEVKN